MMRYQLSSPKFGFGFENWAVVEYKNFVTSTRIEKIFFLLEFLSQINLFED